MAAVLDGRGSWQPLPLIGLYGPKPSAREAAPQLLPLEWPGIAVAIRVSRARGPGQPAQHAPGLPANNYSGKQASGLRENLL